MSLYGRKSDERCHHASPAEASCNVHPLKASERGRGCGAHALCRHSEVVPAACSDAAASRLDVCHRSACDIAHDLLRNDGRVEVDAVEMNR